MRCDSGMRGQMLRQGQRIKGDGRMVHPIQMGFENEKSYSPAAVHFSMTMTREDEILSPLRPKKNDDAAAAKLESA